MSKPESSRCKRKQSQWRESSNDTDRKTSLCSGGSAAMRLSDGSIISSVFVDTPNEAANLCHETGAICEAHKRNTAVVATACVSREAANQDFVILSPCGICQERLAFWGPNVEVAVAKSGAPTSFEVRKLSELQPYYWARSHTTN